MELAYKPGISTGHGVVVPAYSELLVKSPLPVETGWWLISEQIKYGTDLSADLLECDYLTYFSFLSAMLEVGKLVVQLGLVSFEWKR